MILILNKKQQQHLNECGRHTHSRFRRRIILVIFIIKVLFFLLVFIFIFQGIRLICICRLQKNSVHFLYVSLQVVI